MSVWTEIRSKQEQGGQSHRSLHNSYHARPSSRRHRATGSQTTTAMVSGWIHVQLFCPRNLRYC